MSVDPYTTLAATLVDADASQVRSGALADLKAWLAELVPGVDTEGPVINTLLLYPLAFRQAATDSLIQVMRTYSLLSPLPIDTVADDALRTSLRQLQAAEYGIESVAGRSASGVLRLTFRTGSNRVVPEGAQFTCAGGIAITSAAYILRSQEELSQDPRVQLLTQVGSQYVTTIPVSMVNPGSLGNVVTGTSFSSAVAFADLITVAAAVNFAGGRDALDAGDMAADFLDSRVLPSMGSRDQIVSLLRGRTDIGDVQELGVVGFGDPEMHRDKLSLLPVGAGRCDIYVAASSFPTALGITLAATPIARSNNGPQRYSISIGRDVAPGFLDILSATEVPSGKVYDIVEVIRGLDTSPILGEQLPALSVVSQGTFSRYQTASVIVEDSSTFYVPESTVAKNVQLLIQYQPGIETIQSLVSQRQTRYVAGDTLVRSAIPLRVSIQVRLYSSAGDFVPEVSQLKQAVLSEISRKPLRMALYASDLIVAMSPFLRTTLAVRAIDFYASYVHPDGRRISLQTRDALEVPNNPAEQLSARTIAMYSDADAIQFSVEQLIGPEIP